ncbi:OmpA family protein [Flavobacterium silvaticum]|uniref:OmpA family protein n=1 Tax=Flavobacterium silvaticum TaxID=1852020 RepID=A0A972FVK8_9FLAO|nr:OmpA family protein [Flavobacterium silvaticum]NMH28837.1 OmpA family protein [Flavobacterium silvaticum]
MKNRLVHIALAGLFSVTSLYAQEGAEKRANKNFEKYAYVDAIKTYERIANKGYKNPALLQNLADSYYFQSDFTNAAKWYGELFAMSQDVAPEYYYRYAQSLKATGDNAKGDQMLATFASKNASDPRSKLYNAQKNYREVIAKNSGRYKLEDAGINSSASDYGSAVWGNKMVFTTARDTGNFAKRTDRWDGKYLTNFYEAILTPDGTLSDAQKLKGSVKTRFHEGSAAFTKDGKTMYFTRNNFNGTRGRDAKNKTNLKIYWATLKDSVWSDPKEVPFDSNDYSVAHPSLSPDGKTMYFASDMPGGFGGSDLYKVSVGADGTFGAPENLGASINTPGRESFPFMSGDNELYFSSDGYPGLGGFDIFVSKLDDKGAFGEIFNVGADANSPKDDFAYYINSETRKGFLSSNRDGGKGSDDIYKFVETKKLDMKKVQQLVGKTEDVNTTAAIPNATITLSDENFKVIKTVKSDAQGKYDLGEVETGKKYYVKAEAEGYITKEVPVIITSDKDKTELPFLLDPVVQAVKVGDNLADAFKIRLIYFDFDKSDIRNDAAVDLAKILDVLEKNPTMKLDIQSHTDSRGTAKYNQKLSDRRAQSTLKWLLSHGVAKHRLTAKGYGESQLVNKCSDGVECSEDEHQANRRSLFVITAL